MGMEGSVIVGMRIPLLEGRKPASEQDWDRVLSTLRDLGERAENLHLATLWAGAVRAEVTVLAQRKKDLKAAEEAARSALTKAGVSRRSEFLVRSALGEAYADKKQWDAAAQEFVDVLGIEVEGHPFERFNALVSGSVSIGQTDSSAGLAYAREAVAVAEDTEHFPATETAKALCELAVAEWLAGDMASCFSAFDRAADLLFAQAERTDRWKDLMVVFGHCAGYIAQTASGGEPPERTADGSAWHPPQRGVFRIEVPERVQYYAEMVKTRPPAIEMTLLAMFAESVGNHERAAYWAMRGMDASRKAGMTISQSVLSEITIPCFLEMDNFGAAMDAGVEAGVVSMASDVARKTGQPVVTTAFEPLELLGEKPNDNWAQADVYTAGFSLVPAVLRICTVALDDRERARQLGEDLAGICRLLGEKGTDKLLWAEAAEILALAFSFDAGQVAMLQRGNAIAEERHRSIKAICYMAATVQQDAVPEEAIQGHLAVIGYLIPLLGGLRSVYKRILLPFFARYWQIAFMQSRFRFKTPLHVEQALAAALEQPAEQQVGAILQVMADGLGVPVPPDLRRLLKGNE